MEELKECPFCGGEASIDEIAGNPYTDESYAWGVGCKKCNIGWYEETKEKAISGWNRRPAPENKALTLDELRKMVDERVWVQYFDMGMYGLVAYRSDPDGDDGDDVYITNNLGGRNTYEEVLADGGIVYRHKPEEEK